ncbi:MAG: hypothetical protein EOS50_15625 [Mesorhizobium sp.]|nr:MAG: hypothetical protein EOS51_04560 [Mesorhizobium sp.]TGU01474.1 hypothetical protein EN807_12535 [Mesorhizobium sp. M5C.F.Ca.ET.164.01.1.1]RWD85539.1 MAG: hypothetical protein EOS48_05120 [Mesorhizobium sp.]RWE53239.1 MAG: hypothetical protein EOS67_28180 [Mesorhizobium sp.]RWF01100.1 MAG: hypothetical protein EOS68_08760 [Mesorhizobium sp.]
MQGLLVHRYHQSHYAVLLFGIEDGRRAQRFVARWLAHTPHGAQDPLRLAGPVLNFGFTWLGLRVLLADHVALDTETGRLELDFGFTDQTPHHPAVREQLGFIGASAPELWWDGRFGSDAIHMAVYAAFDDDGQAARTLSDLRQSAKTSGLIELRLNAFSNGALSGRRPDGGVLHFGYRDGVTAPVVDWDDGKVQGTTNFREFVMGYPSPGYKVSPQSAGPWQDFARDGSFACLAWIHQDVAAFNRFLDNNAAASDGIVSPQHRRDWLAAKMMGRWPDGSPLARHPTAPPATADLDDHFGFADDPNGVRCPLSAHIRIVNARDDELTFPNRSRFPNGPPKFIRRGFSYGPPFEGISDDGIERGIVGTFLCARVNEQFYTVLRWMQRTGFAEHFHRKPYSELMQDALFGNRSKSGADTSFPIRRENHEADNLKLSSFINFRGVSVLLVPSMSSLGVLSAGTA